MHTHTHLKSTPTHRTGHHPRLPYAVEDARFATFALAHAYAAFLSEETGGREVRVAKQGVIVDYVVAVAP